MSPECPDLESLFAGLAENSPEARAHIASCPACAAVVEDHRQLEKDLLRIADPLPPADFLHKVMAKVEAQPVPASRDVWVGAAILFASLLGVLMGLGLDAGSAGKLGASLASGLVTLRTALLGLSQGISALWSTAALPVAAGASLLLLALLFGLRRLASDPTVTA
jgi:anti-sigma factor RsiW